MLNDGFVHKDFIEPYLAVAIRPTTVKYVLKKSYTVSDRKEGMHINKYDGACTVCTQRRQYNVYDCY